MLILPEIARPRNPLAMLVGAGVLALVQLPAPLLGPGEAHAVPLRINFSGSIGTSGSFQDPTGLFARGDPISGFWELETETADTSSLPTQGRYPQTGAPAFQINIGSSVFSDDGITIQILDGHVLGIRVFDAYDVLGGIQGGASSIAGLSSVIMQITLRDLQLDPLAPSDALSSDGLPAFAPDPSAFNQGGLGVVQAQGSIQARFNGMPFFLNLQIDQTAIATAVPAPASLALFCFGLAALGFFRRRA